MVLTGPDASHHQGSINWQQVKSAGHSYAFIKATEGRSYQFTDWYNQNIGPLKASGLVPGAYHFLRSDSDPVAQADYFINTVGNFTDMLAAVDVETGSNNSKPTADQARAFANRFEERVPGHQIIVYTGRWYWRDTIGNPPGSDIGPLWHSAYSSSPGALYGGWDSFTFWQHTSSGSCPGIAGNCDLNKFYGTLDELRILTGRVPTPAPVPDPVPEDFMGDEMLILANCTDGRGALVFLGDAGPVGWFGLNSTDRSAYAASGIVVVNGLTTDGFAKWTAFPRLEVPPANV